LNTERDGQAQDVVESNVALSPLDLPEVADVHGSGLRDRCLRQPLPFPGDADACAELPWGFADRLRHPSSPPDCTSKCLRFYKVQGLSFMQRCVYANAMTGSVVQEARVRAGLSRRQLATLAGVPTSTVSRAETDTSPSVDMVRRLVTAAGFDLDMSVRPRVDMAAVRTARAFLDPATGLEPDPVVVERWTAIGVLRADGTVRDPAEIAFRAGVASMLAARPGAQSWEAASLPSANAGADRLAVARLRSSWAVTGGVAANRLLPTTDAPWLVVYTSQPGKVAAALDAEPCTADAVEGVPVLTLPFDLTTEIGVWRDDTGRRWADPLQVVIDCYAGNGRMPDQADRLIAAVTGA